MFESMCITFADNTDKEFYIVTVEEWVKYDDGIDLEEKTVVLTLKQLGEYLLRAHVDNFGSKSVIKTLQGGKVIPIGAASDK